MISFDQKQHLETFIGKKEMISFIWQILLTRNNQIFKFIANYVWTRLGVFFGFVLFVWGFFCRAERQIVGMYTNGHHTYKQTYK